MLNKVPQRVLMVLLIAVAYIACRMGVAWSQRQYAHTAPAESAQKALAVAVDRPVEGHCKGYSLLPDGTMTLWLLPTWSSRAFPRRLNVADLDLSREMAEGIWVIRGQPWYSPDYRAPDAGDSEKSAWHPPKPAGGEPPKPSRLASAMSFGMAGTKK